MQVEKIDLPKSKLLKLYPQIKGFHFVSCTEGSVSSNGHFRDAVVVNINVLGNCT